MVVDYGAAQVPGEELARRSLPLGEGESLGDHSVRISNRQWQPIRNRPNPVQNQHKCNF
jgi:hypothetical protein